MAGALTPELGDRVRHKESEAEGSVVQVRPNGRGGRTPVVEVLVDKDGRDGYHLAGRTIRSSFMFWERT